MSELTVLQAINAALAFEIERDQDVVVLGEDVGTSGGIFRATQGLQDRFGSSRLIDTPLDEKGIAAHAIGMAMYGMKPIVEIQFSGFIHDAFEHLMFFAAKYRWLTGGEYQCPLVVRAPSYGGIKGGFWHSQSVEAYYIHGGGMKIVAPSTPADAYGLLLAAIRDPDPVLVIEPVPLYRAMKGEVVEEGVASDIGVAEVVREGTDCTVLTYGPLRHAALRTAEAISARSWSVEVIDLRTLVPLDIGTIIDSARKTGRVIVFHEAPLSGGPGAELAALIQEQAFGYLHTPIERVAGHDLPYAFAGGDEYYRPSEQRLHAAIRRTMEFAF